MSELEETVDVDKTDENVKPVDENEEDTEQLNTDNDDNAIKTEKTDEAGLEAGDEKNTDNVEIVDENEKNEEQLNTGTDNDKNAETTEDLEAGDEENVENAEVEDIGDNAEEVADNPEVDDKAIDDGDVTDKNEIVDAETTDVATEDVDQSETVNETGDRDADGLMEENGDQQDEENGELDETNEPPAMRPKSAGTQKFDEDDNTDQQELTESVIAEDGDDQTAPSDTANNDAQFLDDNQAMQVAAVAAPTKANLEKSATVKLVLFPSDQVITCALSLATSITEIKQLLSEQLKMSPHDLLVFFNGRSVDNQFVISDFGIDANETVAFEIKSIDPANKPLKLVSSRKPDFGGDVITVRLLPENSSSDKEFSEIKEINVEIEKQLIKKPFLGGYRHKKTGIEYHHASSQTQPKPRPVVSSVEVNNRDTQTVQSQHQTQQTSKEVSTQMTKPGLYISSVSDKLIIPGRYETADKYETRILSKIITIQTYYRRWLAKQYVSKLKVERDDRQEWEHQEEIRKRKEKEERIAKEYERRMNPKSKEDFDLLYHALEKWRKEEIVKINATLSGAERKAALCQLLEQETELIAAMDRHQLDAGKENKEKAIQNILRKAAAPKKWRDQQGKLLEMDTPFTLRGKELLGIYNSLQMKYLTQDERLDVLLTLKHTVKEHECKLTQELVELIDREADLLIRGVSEEKLMGLRKRISTLFLQYCKTPTFNPEIASLLPVPQDPAQLKNNIHFCSSCGKYLKSTDFPLGIKSRGIGKCRKCISIDNVGRGRQDQSAYKKMLWYLRKREDGEALLIEESDLKYLVNDIWEGMSILSCWDDLVDLELVRWDVLKPWSPWNCILLTKDEAEAHEQLGDLSKAYGNMLVHRVKQKHVLARNYFHSISSAMEKMKLKELELQNVRQISK